MQGNGAMWVKGGGLRERWWWGEGLLGRVACWRWVVVPNAMVLETFATGV
jgi:hypothetical protein